MKKFEKALDRINSIVDKMWLWMIIGAAVDALRWTLKID